MEAKGQDDEPPVSIAQVISHVDQFKSPGDHQFVNLRSFDPQQIQVDNQVLNNIHLPRSRLLVVPMNTDHPSSNSFHLTRSDAHFTFTGIQCSEDHVQQQLLPEQATINVCECDSNISSQINEILPNKSKVDLMQSIQSPSTSSAIASSSSSCSLLGRTRMAGKRKIRKPIVYRDDVIEESGNLPFGCESCNRIFATNGDWQEHQSEHATVKRRGLSLELKIEIIKRINGGEKKSDMAEEYSVNRATIKSIIKKSEEYMKCWKKGMFNPESKRLKRPKREDVEQALYSWYTQSLQNDVPVSGIILCAKAVNFAHKLGHFDFKATHGWLDRFKKRKKITFGRGGSKRKVRDDKVCTEIKTQELHGSLLPQLLIDFEPLNIFAIEHVGLFYRALPTIVQELTGQKCPGGIKAKNRLSVVLCSNMTGSEKFPLLIVGKSTKMESHRCTKSFQYVANDNAWLTSEIISSWLLDIDSWFYQQSRKAIVMVPSLPIYSRPINLRSIKLLITPADSLSPLLQLVVPTFKEVYRKIYLEQIMYNLSKDNCSHPYKMHLPICLQLLSKSWQLIAEDMIVSGFQRIGLAKYGLWGMVAPTDNIILQGADEVFRRAVHSMGASEEDVTRTDFTHFDSNLQVCNLMGDDDILAKVTGMTEADTDSDDDDNCGIEALSDNLDHTSRPSITQVTAALDGLKKYIQCQEGSQEMFRILGQLEYIVYKVLPEPIPTTNNSNTTERHY